MNHKNIIITILVLSTLYMYSQYREEHEYRVSLDRLITTESCMNDIDHRMPKATDTEKFAELKKCENK